MRKIYAIGMLLVLMLVASCVDIEEYENTPSGNVEALWKIMDEHYCFFEEKQKAYGIDWDDVHERYARQAQRKLTVMQEYELLTGMIGELRDGHVNLSTPFDYGRNWSWKDNYPSNFSDTLQRRYLGTDYRLTGGVSYRILDNNIGYMYVGTFENTIGEGNLDEIFLYLAPCQGLIVDVRDNGGGMLTEAEKLAARFCDKEMHVGYMAHKTGPGHNDFSALQEQWLKPTKGIRWHKKVCVLTNRSVYSAANEFVKYMKLMPQCTIIGDNTGGGAGMPYSAELPNGWRVRFSACPMYDTERKSTEGGIEPDIAVGIGKDAIQNNVDSIIETACRSMYIH